MAKNATWPLRLIGATIGNDSTLKWSNVPPPGTFCPVTAIRRRLDASAPSATWTTSNA